MTVDEILASGQYTDRRGRVWAKHTYYHGTVEWFHPLGNGACYINTLDEMRLLIERDLHRAECHRAGASNCIEHPVPVVYWDAREYVWMARPAGGWPPGEDVPLYFGLPDAMDAARALAVGE